MDTVPAWVVQLRREPRKVPRALIIEGGAGAKVESPPSVS